MTGDAELLAELEHLRMQHQETLQILDGLRERLISISDHANDNGDNEIVSRISDSMGVVLTPGEVALVKKFISSIELSRPNGIDQGRVRQFLHAAPVEISARQFLNRIVSKLPLRVRGLLRLVVRIARRIRRSSDDILKRYRSLLVAQQKREGTKTLGISSRTLHPNSEIYSIWRDEVRSMLNQEHRE